MSGFRQRMWRRPAVVAGSVVLVGLVATAWTSLEPPGEGGTSTNTPVASDVKPKGSAEEDGGVRLAQHPTTVAQTLYPHHFTDIETMTATSPLVIRGHVTAVEPGDWVGPPEDRERVRDVTIVVDDVLASRSGAKPDKIVLDEWGWDSQGRGYRINGVTWSQPGDQGFYFLKPVEGMPGRYALINSQGRVLVENGKLKPTADHHDEIHAEITNQTKSQLAGSVHAAFRKFQAGKIEPQRIP